MRQPLLNYSQSAGKWKPATALIALLGLLAIFGLAIRQASEEETPISSEIAVGTEMDIYCAFLKEVWEDAKNGAVATYTKIKTRMAQQGKTQEEIMKEYLNKAANSIGSATETMFETHDPTLPTYDPTTGEGFAFGVKINSVAEIDGLAFVDNKVTLVSIKTRAAQYRASQDRDLLKKIRNELNKDNFNPTKFIVKKPILNQEQKNALIDRIKVLTDGAINGMTDENPNGSTVLSKALDETTLLTQEHRTKIFTDIYVTGTKNNGKTETKNEGFAKMVGEEKTLNDFLAFCDQGCTA